MLRVDEETTSPISEESLRSKSSITRLDSQKIDVVIIEDYNGVMRSDLIDHPTSHLRIVVSADPKLQTSKRIGR